MYYGKFMGLTAPMAMFQEPFWMLCSKYSDKDVLNKQLIECQKFFSLLKLTPSADDLSKLKETFVSVIPVDKTGVTFQYKSLAKMMLAINRGDNPELNIAYEGLEKSSLSTGYVVNEKVLEFTEAEFKIISFFVSKKDRFFDAALSGSFTRFLGINLRSLNVSQGARSNLLKEYAKAVHSKDLSVKTKHIRSRKFNTELINILKATPISLSEIDGIEDPELAEILKQIATSDRDMFISYWNQVRDMNHHYFNLKFDLNLSNEEYQEVGFKLDELGLIGFTPYAFDFLKFQAKEYGVSQFEVSLNEDARKELLLLQRDIESMIWRMSLCLEG